MSETVPISIGTAPAGPPAAPAPQLPIARLLSLLVIVLLMSVVGVMFYQVMAPFILPLFLAGIATILCRPLFNWFLTRFPGRPSVASGLTTATVLLVGLGPFVVIIVMTTFELTSVAQEHLSGVHSWGDLRTELDKGVDQSFDRIQPLLPAGWDRAKLQQSVLTSLQSQAREIGERTLQLATSTWGLLGTVVSLLVSFGVFLLGLYFFLIDGPHFVAKARELLPLHADYQHRLLEQFGRVTRAVVLGTFFAALVQGVATAGAVWFLGFGHFFVFLMACIIAALIPMVGTVIIWLPCAIALAVQGHYLAALGLTLWGSLVVGTLDNVVRTYVLNSDAQLHPLLAFVSVLGALQVMGLWGIFIGPIVASCLYALVKIFNEELTAYLRERAPAGPATAPSDIIVSPPAPPEEPLQPAPAES